MGGRKKLLLCVTGCLTLLFFLFVGFGLFLPYFINLEPIKEKMQTLLSQRVEGKVEFQKMDLFYFPRLGVEVHHVSLSIPETVAGTLKSVRVYPELLPILKGKLRVAKIQIESPDFTIQFPMKREEDKEKPGATVLERFKEITTRASGMVPDIRLVVNGGKLNLAKGSQTILSFFDINASMTGSPRDAKIELACCSNLWEKMSVEAKMNPVSLQGYGRIEVESFYPHLLPASLFSGFPLNVKDSKLNLKMSVEAKGQGVYQADVEGSMGRLIVGKGKEEIAIKGKRFQGNLHMGEESTEISLEELSLEYPRLTLLGKMKIDRKVPLFDVEVQGREVDVTSTRDVALFLAEKIPVTKKVFDIVKEGRIPLITFQSRGSAISALDETENFSIKGNILDGKISIPVGEPRGDKDDFSLEKTTGDIVITRGVAEGRNLRARWKNQQLDQGVLRLGLKGEDAPFHLEIEIDTDLFLLPPLLSRISKDQTFLKEMARFHEVEGRAKGRLVLGESLKSIGVKINIRDLNLFGRYDRLPYPITIDGGGGGFDGERLEFRNFSGKVGNTSFAQLTAQLGLEPELYLEILSGKLAISVDEAYAWLSAQEFLRDDLKGMKVTRGTLRLSEVKLKGPVLRPENWTFQAAGEVTGIVVETTSVPGPFTVSSGTFMADPERLHLSNVEANVLDASLGISGTLHAYLQGLQEAELDLSGQVTPKEMKWLSDLLQPKLRTSVRAPFSISGAHLSWHKDRHMRFNGDLKVKKGPQISLDIFQDPRQLRVDRLLIRDETSQANSTLTLKERTIDLTFSGQLSERTLNKILSGHPFQEGWVKGDFQARIDLDQPMQSVAQGKIEGNHLSFPSLFEKPLEIEEVSLNAKENHITADRANFAWGGKRLALSGDIRFSDAKAVLDISLSTESIDLDELKDLRPQKKEEGEKQGGLGFTLEGVIRFKSNTLKYEGFIWEPFQANTTFGERGVEVNIEETKLCGISTPGVVKMIDQELLFDIQPFFRSREFGPTAKCLLDEEVRATGDFELKGRIVAQGKPEDLFDSFKGDLEFQAKDGQINYSVGLFRILEFINITEMYRGKLPDMKKEGLPYKLISARGSFQNGRFIMKDVTLDGPTMEMVAQGEIDLRNQQINFTVLVAPLKTADRIIKLIPLVGEILDGTLVTIPLAVHGNLKDPRVTYLSPSAIGSELLAMMQRTLRLPFRVIEPLMPRKGEESGEER